MARFKWTCDVCKKPIKDGMGYVAVDNREAADRAAMWEAWEVASAARREAEGVVVLIADDVPPLRLVTWDVLHRACDPRPDEDDYWISVERIRTLDALLRWNEHLHQKDWTRHTNWDRFIYQRLGGS